MNEVAKRLGYLEREIEELKRQRTEVKIPPLVDPSFVKEVAGVASLQCRHNKITEAMLEHMERGGHPGLSVLASIYQDPESGRKMWYVNTVQVQELLRFPIEEVVNVLTPLADLYRLKILSMLIKGDRTSTEIGRELNIEGGQLYHHLDQLLKNHYIERVDRGLYSIVSDGWQALLTVVQLGYYMRVKAPELRKLLEEKKQKRNQSTAACPTRK